LQLDYKEQESLRKYLLGNLPPGEIAVLEERLLTDTVFYDELLMLEDELIDQYLSGEQSQAERESFEAHFALAPERQQKLRFARALKKYLNRTTNEAEARDVVIAKPALSKTVSAADNKRWLFPFLPRNPIVAYSLAATFVLVVGLFSWTVMNRLKNPASHEAGQTLAVVLTPGLSRSLDGGGIKKVSVPAGTDTLELQLELPKAEYATYRAEVLRSDQTMVATIEGLKPATASAKASITMSLSATLFKRDDYSVKLAGMRADGVYEEVSGYVFRVLN